MTAIIDLYSSFVVNWSLSNTMHGKGRATDNAFIGNRWKMVKYEDIYLKAYEDGIELHNGLAQCFYNWNFHRRHSKIGDKYPSQFYLQTRPALCQ